jgi:hypothetical protein
LSYRDLEELRAERGVEVSHVTLYRWVQRFGPLVIESARPFRHAPSDRWFVDETYVKGAGRWRYGYRAVDVHPDALALQHRPLLRSGPWIPDLFLDDAISSCRGERTTVYTTGPTGQRRSRWPLPHLWLR